MINLTFNFIHYPIPHTADSKFFKTSHASSQLMSYAPVRWTCSASEQSPPLFPRCSSPLRSCRLLSSASARFRAQTAAKTTSADSAFTASSYKVTAFEKSLNMLLQEKKSSLLHTHTSYLVFWSVIKLKIKKELGQSNITLKFSYDLFLRTYTSKEYLSALNQVLNSTGAWPHRSTEDVS